MNLLLGEMKRSLVELVKGLDGQLNKTQAMEDVQQALAKNEVTRLSHVVERVQHDKWVTKELLAFPVESHDGVDRGNVTSNDHCFPAVSSGTRARSVQHLLMGKARMAFKKKSIVMADRSCGSSRAASTMDCNVVLAPDSPVAAWTV